MMQGIKAIAVAAMLAFHGAAGGTVYHEALTAEADQKKVVNPYEKGGTYEHMKIVYKFGKRRVVLTAEDVTDWVRYWPDGHWDIDDDRIAEYVEGLQKHFDTWNRTKVFETTGKKTIRLKGDYGWKLDREKEVKEISKLLRRNGTTIHPLHFLTEAASRDNSVRDYGDSYVEIDLSRQVLWLYEHGKVTLRTDIVSGMMNTSRQTPGGIFCVKYKQSPAVLKGADYQTPVSFWMPFKEQITRHLCHSGCRLTGGLACMMLHGSRALAEMPVIQGDLTDALICLMIRQKYYMKRLGKDFR